MDGLERQALRLTIFPDHLDARCDRLHCKFDVLRVEEAADEED